MNNQKFSFQDPGEGIHEAEVIEVLVSNGDHVKEGQDVLVVETDKATFELAAPRAGEIGSVDVHPGDTIRVGDTLLTFRSQNGDQAEEAARVSERSEGGLSGAPIEEQSTEPSKREQRASSAADKGLAEEAGSGRPPVPATPATRRLARDLGVDLMQVRPSGAQGRVIDSDVRTYAERSHARHSPETSQQVGAAADEPAEFPDFSQEGPVETQPLRSVRKKTAERMARSWAEIPHVTHQDVWDITELERWRERLAPKVEAAGGKLTLTVLVMKALCASLREFPRFNASLDAKRGMLIYKRYYNIGIAVDTERGLIVPVLRDAASKHLLQLATELAQLAERTRKGKAQREELLGSTFTISNLGPLGGTSFTPIINYPEVAILGLGRAKLQPLVLGEIDGHDIATRLTLPVSLAFDHRVIDGAQAARFVTSLGRRLSDIEEFVLSV